LVTGGSLPQDTAQVVEAARMHRIAFEVEEDIPRIGRRQTTKA
jgi:hypothetical protein